MKWTFPKKVKRVFNILSIVYIVLGCCFYSWTVYIRDEYPTKGYLADGWSMFIPYIISAMVIILCIVTNCLKKEKLCMAFSIVGLFAVVLGYMGIVFQTVNYLDIKKTYEQGKQTVISVNLNELDHILKNDVNKYVYVGRDSCSVCQTIYPLIENYSSRVPETVYYYNTELDRYDNKQEMNQILDEMNIVEVPTMIQFIDGDIKEYVGDSLWNLVQ